MANHVFSLLVAIMIDLMGISIPNKFHPVAWMGSMITWMQRLTPSRGNFHRFVFSGLLSLVGIFVFSILGFALQSTLNHFNPLIAILIEGCFFSLFFSISGLSHAANQIYTALLSNDLQEARRSLSWHLVSRDTISLDESQVAAATIESIAENTSDSFIAPVFYYLIFGLPGVLVYRFVNTADAMLGYHTPDKEWLGKIPARLDDLLNLIPARITALFLVISSLINRNDTYNALSAWWSDRYQTTSPNAGHPMSVMAGALNLELTKPGHYRLGTGGKQPGIQDIQASIRLMYLVLLQVVVLSTLGIIINECIK